MDEFLRNNGGDGTGDGGAGGGGGGGGGGDNGDLSEKEIEELIENYDEPDEPNVVVKIPRPSLEIGSLEYKVTSDYTWANFEKNVSGADASSYTVTKGPNLFLKGIQLEKEKVTF